MFEFVNRCYSQHLDGILNDQASEDRINAHEGIEELEEAILERET